MCLAGPGRSAPGAEVLDLGVRQGRMLGTIPLEVNRMRVRIISLILIFLGRSTWGLVRGVPNLLAGEEEEEEED